ncbi:hypothetical protein [Billgrantia endophytica]|uniref:Uncharacterized protein n=1 Tax=Billgrantia endophytica TaxID=2033802 RepID=A0A2N7U043_9GAMM|nr:hypothetical protein [Halomonas endophytica]PMR73800.1 hypothetical protein C1H69_15845 [Halomonas endophytica]
MLDPIRSTSPMIDSFAFDYDGFTVLRGCLPKSVIDHYAAAVAAYLLRCEPPKMGVRQVHPEVLRRRQAVYGRTTGISGLVLHERVLKPLNMLAGESSYLLGVGSLESEQVLSACNACAGAPAHLSVWIALRSIPLEAGLKVSPGSHAHSRRSLQRLLAAEPALAGRLQRMREEGASLEQWRELETHLLWALRAQEEQQAEQNMRLLALHKGDVLIQQQGLISSAARVEGRSCLVARYGAEQLHRNHYFSDLGTLPSAPV